MRLWLRLFIAFAFTTVTGAILLAVVVVNLARRTILREAEIRLNHEAQMAAEAIAALVSDTAFQSTVVRLGRNLTTRLTVIDASGTVLADSRAAPDQMENHLIRPEVAMALREGSATAVHTSRTLGSEMLYVARRFTRGGQVLIMRTSTEFAAIRQFEAGVRRSVTIAAVLMISVSLLVSLLVSRRLTRPIEELVRTSERIAQGDFTARVSIRRYDELGRLALRMNDMASQLQRSLTRAGAEKQEFELVVRAMKDGILELDAERRVVLANTSFCRAFGISDCSELVGKPILELVRNPDFHRVIERASGQPTVNEEVKTGERILQVVGGVVGTEPLRLLFIFHDVTEQRYLERLKTEFIANVSHELRTPLTAIKGFTETLQAEAGPEQQRFLSVIARHTDRLIAMVNDLLTIGRMEAIDRRMEITDVDLVQLLNNVVQMFERSTTEKHLALTVDIPPGIPKLRGDQFLLEQLFVNLLDNAVKYTPDGGQISIRAGVESVAGAKGQPSSTKQQYIAVSISDTGVGIPAEHIPRIFERFYVVDKNRSREVGGTGLGLAIVKHVVLAHGGNIAVQSTVGKGSVFTVRLPAADSATIQPGTES